MYRVQSYAPSPLNAVWHLCTEFSPLTCESCLTLFYGAPPPSSLPVNAIWRYYTGFFPLPVYSIWVYCTCSFLPLPVNAYDNTVPSSFPLPMNATRLYCRIPVVISFYLWMLSFSCTSTDDVGALVTEAGHVGHLFPRQLQQLVPFIIIRTWRTSQWRVHKQGEGVAMKPGW